MKINDLPQFVFDTNDNCRRYELRIESEDRKWSGYYTESNSVRVWKEGERAYHPHEDILVHHDLDSEEKLAEEIINKINNNGINDKLGLFIEFKKAVDTRDSENVIYFYEALKNNDFLDVEMLNAYEACLNDETSMWERLFPLADVWLESAKN
jgi:hypothetical protein